MLLPQALERASRELAETKRQRDELLVEAPQSGPSLNIRLL